VPNGHRAVDHVKDVWRIEGKFGFTMQGFLEAPPFATPEQRVPKWAPAPNGQEFTNPSVLFGFLPPQADLKMPSGYYPYAESGYIELKKDLSFTGKFRLNLSGNTIPFDESRDLEGRYFLRWDGTGTLTFVEGGIDLGQAFIVRIDDSEFLIMWSWTNTKDTPHRRAVSTGHMKLMT
jgi:hypothetical protein